MARYTSRTERAQNIRSRRRRVFRVVFLFSVTFAAFRFFGPALVIIAGEAITPVTEPGDVVLARPFRRTPPERGDFVLVDTPFQGEHQFVALLRFLGERIPYVPVPTVAQTAGVSALVPRVVVAVPGDTVVWTGTEVIVTPSNTIGPGWELPREPLHDALVQPEQQRTLSGDEYFLIALQPGYVDGTVSQPVQRRSIRYRIESVVLPPERRTVISSGMDQLTR